MDDTVKQVELFWNAKPCDSDRSSADPDSRAYFLDIERDRYDRQPHIKEILSTLSWHGKNVLEIGTGVGTDARLIISSGGRYTGINIDYGSTHITRQALKTFSLKGAVQQASATNLPFADNSFDVVYSFGVLHHIPEVERAVHEIRRVLRPGGHLLIMLYNRTSVNYYVEICLLRRLFRRLLLLPGALQLFVCLGFPRQKLERHRELCRCPMTSEEWLSRNTDGPDNPYSRVYSATEARQLLDGFSIGVQRVDFFDASHWGSFGRLIPRSMVRLLGKYSGWHRIIHATKTTSQGEGRL